MDVRPMWKSGSGEWTRQPSGLRSVCTTHGKRPHDPGSGVEEPRAGADYHDGHQPITPMPALLLIPALAAVGYSILYLVFGGGLAGAVVIFLIAKLFGK